MSLFNSGCIKGNILCILLAYSMSYSLDIFNLILIVLSPCLTGFLFDLYPKFRTVLHWFFHFSLSYCAFSALPSFVVFIYSQMSMSKSVCGCKCVCSWMTGQGLWTLRPGWRIEAPWKPLQPALTASRGGGARERRSKLKRQGQEVDMKQKIHRASTVQGSIYGLCRISKRVSAVKVEEYAAVKNQLL